MPCVQVRAAVFTINNPGDKKLNLEINSKVRGAVWQLEVGESGTPHYQGYIEFTDKMSFKAIKEILGNEAHVEARQGTREQAIAYCCKEDTRQDGPWTYGKMDVLKPGDQGRRSDLESACEIIINSQRNINEGLREVAETTPVTFVKFHKGLTALAYRMNSEVNRSPPNVEWIYGPTGVGKTRYAVEKTSTFFIKDGTIWWDGYEYQETIIIDDFDGNWNFRNFLRLLDRYPYQGQIKGGYVWINSPNIIITCDRRPAELLHELSEHELAQLMRRIAVVRRIDREDLNDS